MEIWGLCNACSEWFRCPSEAKDAAWCCPVCGREPVAIENRRQPDRSAYVHIELPSPARLSPARG